LNSGWRFWINLSSKYRILYSWSEITRVIQFSLVGLIKLQMYMYICIFSLTVDLKINSALNANISKRSNVYLSCYSECLIITFVILDIFSFFVWVWTIKLWTNWKRWSRYSRNYRIWVRFVGTVLTANKIRHGLLHFTSRFLSNYRIAEKSVQR